MGFDAWQYLTFFGVDGIKQARKGNLLARCPNFEGLHPKGDQRRSFGILEEAKWDRLKSQWVPAGTANCYVCGGFSLERLTAKLLEQLHGRPFNDLEAYNFLMEHDWLPEDTDNLDAPSQVINFLEGLWGEEGEIDTYDPSVIDEYMKGLHPSILERGGIPGAVSVDVARGLFRYGYCERSKRSVIPVFTKTGRVHGVISRATRADDFIRYGVGVPDETFPNPGWKMKLDFLKSTVLYNEDKFNPFRHNTILVIESPRDVAYAYECGLNEYMDIGAIFGAKPSEYQLSRIAEYEHVIDGLDMDNAGREGSEFMRNHLKGKKCTISEFDSFGNKDLGECTPDQVRNLLSRVRKEGSVGDLFNISFMD